jgi:hypothetical protein
MRVVVTTMPLMLGVPLVHVLVFVCAVLPVLC